MLPSRRAHFGGYVTLLWPLPRGVDGPNRTVHNQSQHINRVIEVDFAGLKQSHVVLVLLEQNDRKHQSS